MQCMIAELNKDQEIVRSQAQLVRQVSLIEQLKVPLILECNRQFTKANEALRSVQRKLFKEVELEAPV